MLPSHEGALVKTYNFVVTFMAVAFFGLFSLMTVMMTAKAFVGAIAAILYIIIGVILLLCFRYEAARLPRVKKYILSAFLMAVFMILCILSVTFFAVQPSWDYSWTTYTGALIGSYQPLDSVVTEYFASYPYQLNVSYFLGLFMRIFGPTMMGAYITNFIMIAVSVVGAWAVARDVGDDSTALTVMLLAVLTMALYLYMPIAYSDTLSMPFPIWSFFFANRAMHSEKYKGWQRFVFFAIAGILGGIGYFIKPMAAIMLVALALESLIVVKKPVFQLEGKKLKRLVTRVMPAIVMAAFCLFSYFGIRTVMHWDGYPDQFDYNYSRPNTHWIMMGLNKPESMGGTDEGWGGYSRYDDNFTKSYLGYDAKKEANLKVIKQRLENYGLGGYLSFLYKKLEYTWADGAYYVPVKLERSPVRITALHQYVLDGGNNTVFRTFTQTVHFITMLMIAVNSFCRWKKKDTRTRALELSLLGLIFFLMVWETRSRYVVMYIPVLLVVAAKGLGWTLEGVQALWKRIGERRTHNAAAKETDARTLETQK